jgi:hypothetical protein
MLLTVDSCNFLNDAMSLCAHVVVVVASYLITAVFYTSKIVEELTKVLKVVKNLLLHL